jgi:hypothetical protein
MPPTETKPPGYHPDNEPGRKPGWHCWHTLLRDTHQGPVPKDDGEGNILVSCCRCKEPARMIFEPQAGHGPFADPRTIPPFSYVEGHANDEPCPGPPENKPRLVV